MATDRNTDIIKARVNIALHPDIDKILKQAGSGNRSRGIEVVAIFWNNFKSKEGTGAK